MVRESREHDDESVSDSFRFMTMLPLAAVSYTHLKGGSNVAASIVNALLYQMLHREGF